LSSSTAHASSDTVRVGTYLAVVQFFFALSWTVYVIFLPSLAAQAGIPKHALPWILMLDQLIFVVADYLTGIASDRTARVVGKLGPWVLSITLLSCAAFIALPFVAPGGSPAALLVLTLLWAVTSSALRAPPMTLIGRYAAKPLQPRLVSLSLLGLGLAAAIAPYLTITLRGLDPRVPFVLSSVALALATLGIVAAERRLAAAPKPPVEVKATPPAPTSLPGFLIAALLAALAFQVHANLNSAALYLRHAPAAELPYLMPLFWVGFNLAMLPAGMAVKRWGAVGVMGTAGGVAALSALAAQYAGSLGLLIALQAIAGAAWAGVLMSAFAAALAIGSTGREGRISGLLSSALALASLARLSVVAMEWQKEPATQSALGWWPALGWCLGAALLLAAARSRTARG